MKKSDLGTLKKMLEGTEYEVLNELEKENDKFFVVKKKDIWDGIEFVENQANNEIHKIHSKRDGKIFISEFEYLIIAKPSTESAYEEQLKRIAKEKFGKIKVGDRFEEPCGNIDGLDNVIRYNDNDKWEYVKENDQLFYYHIVIYQQGKWATKIETVEIEVVGSTLYSTKTNNKQEIEIRFESSKPINKNKANIIDYLAKQLESYLNNKQNETKTRD